MSLVDFNHDGIVSESERAIALGAILSAISEIDTDAEISVSIEEDEDYESLSPDELADRWDDLRIQRDILDSEEPDDPDSEAYEEWEEQCELLDEKIEEIEDLIEG